jgi:hypothetical protein
MSAFERSLRNMASVIGRLSSTYSVPERQRLGEQRVEQTAASGDGGIWLASFMHYDLGYFDLEQKTLQPLDNPFGTRLSPMS